MLKLKNYIKDINKFLIIEEFLNKPLEEQRDILQNLYKLKEKFDSFIKKINKIAIINEEKPEDILKEIKNRIN